MRFILTVINTTTTELNPDSEFTTMEALLAHVRELHLDWTSLVVVVLP